MQTETIEKSVVRTKDGQMLTIAPGTETVCTSGEILEFWQKVWDETKELRPKHSVVEEFLIEKRIEVERENKELA